PEGRGFWIPRLVNVVMEQVAVLGYQAGRARAAVVGAEDGNEVEIGLERLDDARDRVGRDHDIGVDEEDDVPPSGAPAGVARGSRSAVPSEPKNDHAMARRHRGRVVRGGVVDHDDLERRRGRSDESRQTFAELPGTVVGGDDHRHGYRHWASVLSLK